MSPPSKRGYAPGRLPRGANLTMVRAVRAGRAAGDDDQAVIARPRPIAERALAPGLHAQVFRHDVAARDGAVPCWTYVSSGMPGRELIFTLQIAGEADAAFPDDPFNLFHVLFQAAGQGARLAIGGVAELSGKRLFDHHVLYAPAQPLAGVAVPPGALAIVMITGDELRAARQLGAQRVLARLGKLYEHYPYPPWSDRRRRGLSLQATFDASVLMQLARASLPEMCVVGDGHADRLELRVLRSAVPQLQRLAELPPDATFALLTGLDPEADACLTWEPGQHGPLGISPPDSAGRLIAGCFIVFLPAQPADGGLLLEDGYAMKLTTASWAALRTALMTGADLDLPATDGMPLRLVWLDERYVAPDGVTFVAPGGWNAYRPAPDPHAPVPATLDRVHLLEVRLLTPQREILARTRPRDLAVMCREIQMCAERVLAARRQTAFEAKLRVRCSPVGHELELAHRGDATPAELHALHQAVRGLAKLPVRDGEVAFEVFLAIDPDAEPSYAVEPS
ncbi:MAG TPA: hypothetical protein VFP84_14575 [Kofleriaceae bacterium]|nr:hypothetical protein [Kofleriaceae bacterium]